MRYGRNRFTSLITICVIALLMGFAQRERTFSCIPNYFPAQPDNKALGPAHGGAAVDRAGNVYVSTDSDRGILVFGPDGTIFVADGYGQNWIHKYDRDRKYLMSFGGPGGNPAEDGKFNRCHGLAVDMRGPKPLLIVCNRESGRVESWDTDGKLVKVLQ